MGCDQKSFVQACWYFPMAQLFLKEHGLVVALEASGLLRRVAGAGWLAGLEQVSSPRSCAVAGRCF